MDVNQDLCFANTTDIMAASVAPTASTANTNSSSSTSSTRNAKNDIDNNKFHEICRSCGKTNAELYDLFQTATAELAETAVASPFNTSSTTCYTHLNSTSTTSTLNSIGCAKSSSSSSPSMSSSSSSLTKSAFDSTAATAKATAKGQSNMENILQEMQIWHLQIKCNDGLPQRICAKCTAQFYMIHKFRRKCLKVQTQLRALYEEGQQKQLVWDERHELRQQQQQQHTENDSQIKTIVPTSTPPTTPVTTTTTTSAAASASVVKVPPELHKVNDLINDNYGQEQALSEKSSPSPISSVNFETNTRNANDATLLDNVAKTMAKTEANATTPSLAVVVAAAAAVTTATAVAAQQPKEKEHPFPLLPQDQKKPPPPMVLNPPAKQHTQQICDNDVVATITNSKRGRLCVDQEELLATHIIFKSTAKKNDDDDNKEEDELRHSRGDKVAGKRRRPKKCHVPKQSTDKQTKDKRKEFSKLSHFKGSTAASATTANPPTEGLFITKAALKAYTIGETQTPSANDNSQCSSTSSSTESSCENQVWQLASANSKQTTTTTMSTLVVQPSSFKTAAPSQALQQVSATVTNIVNDDNNNDHNKDHHHHQPHQQHRDHHQQQQQQQDADTEMNLTDNTCCTSTTNSPRSSSSTLTTKMKQNPVKTEVRFNNLKRSFAKRVRRSGMAASKRGHRYKLNAKTTTKTPTTSRRRALQLTTKTTRSASSNQRSQHELKRLQDIRTCSSSSAASASSSSSSKTTSAHKYQKQLQVEAAAAYNQQTNIAAKSTYENETKNLTTITNKSNGMLKEKEDKLVTPASTIIMEDESSSSIASSSPSSSSTKSSSSSSSSSSATTPAVTDLVKALKEKHETNAYATNANVNVNAIKRRQFISDTSRQGNDQATTTATAFGATCYATSSTNQNSTTNSTSTTMWKTKAAMKANANDMHMDMDVQQQQQIDNEHQTNDINQKPILLPYSTQITTTMAGSTTISSVATTLCSNIDTRSKTFENENQSICSSSCSSNSNSSYIKNIMEEDNNVAWATTTTTTTNETVLSSKDHKVKDIKNNTEQEQLLNNLRPEEADQKQIKHYNLNDDDDAEDKRTHRRQTNVDDHDENDALRKSEATENTYNSMEFINNPLLQQQKPTSATTTGTTASTPPAKVGCMKLIIQRKRGARFKCRRKVDTQPQHTSEQHISPKRRKHSVTSKVDSKVEMESLFALDLNGDYSKEDKALINASNEDLTNDSDMLENLKEHRDALKTHYQIRRRYSSESRDSINSDKREPENREREKEKEQELFKEFNNDSLFSPRLKAYKQDSNDGSETDNSLSYRDHHLGKNEEEDDEDINEFSNHFQITKEHFKFKKELEPLETVPKKLIVRVPLTSLTQDFKRLHLTRPAEDEDKMPEQDTEELAESQVSGNFNENVNSIESNSQQEEETNNLNLSGSSQTELLGFSPTSVTTSNSYESTQKSIEAIRGVEAVNACAASSKINDFINDFQNNCIDSSEIEETTELLPQLPTSSQELSDEIRDVEDTLNGILSEMHDKDMYTPRSTVEHEDFFNHSVYSPLTDAPTTPSQSFYAESPCTVNGNPMSVSPYIHHNMDYNAMTPQSTHSSMGHNSHMSSCGGSTRSANVFSEHYPTYNECFAEESTESELIGFQNDIPCFENLELTNPATPSALLGSNEGGLNDNTANEDESCTPIKTPTKADLEDSLNKTIIKVDKKVVDYVDLCDYNEPTEQFATIPKTEQLSPALPANTAGTSEIIQNIPQYNTNNYQDASLATSHALIQTPNNSMINSTPSHSHYIVTNTAQGPILLANPQVNTGQEQLDNAFKAHANNLQFVTLGQALEANKTRQQTAHIINNPTTELNWAAQAANSNQNGFAQQPVMSSANTNTTTYFINAGGEVYRASIPTPSIQNPTLNTLIVPPAAAQQPQPHSVAFNKPTIDGNENYLQTLQQFTQQQQQQPHIQTQQTQQHQHSPTSQYIMVVNNLGTTPQYYAATQSNLGQPTATTTAMGTPTVLYHQSPASTNNCSSLNNNNANQHQHQHQLLQTTPPTTTAAAATTPPEANRPPPSHTPVRKTVSPTPIQPFPKCADPQQTMHQRINQQLQLQIKQRQLQMLQPRSANCTQKINLICRFCHKRPKFTNNVDYSNHIINMHPAEKPYNCPHCPMHFIRRFERQQHVAQVHGSRYQCAQCGVSFCAQRTLDFHLQKYHANLGRSHNAASSTTSSVNQQQQQNSTSSSSSAITTYQLLQHNQQQRLVRVEDVHVQVTGESRNKRSIDLQLDGSDLSAAAGIQQTRKLCCPDCDGDNDDCCASNKHHDHNDQPISPQQLQLQQQQQQQHQQQQQEQYTGNESVNHQHITIPSPEQTEPDSTTTLRHFRKRQLSDLSPFSSSSSSSTASSTYLNNSNSNCHDNNVSGVVGDVSGGEQIAVERALRGSHNCLLCEESFTNEIALRKHHHLAHGTQASTAFVCTVCSRGFRMRTALQRHMETHDAEGRPYECSVCKVRFPRPSQLTLHKLTVHKFEKPNCCEECGKLFGSESALKAHAKIHEAATATSTSQLSSCMFMDPTTTTTIAATTTTTTEPTSNDLNVHLQLSTSGEIAAAQILP